MAPFRNSLQRMRPAILGLIAILWPPFLVMCGAATVPSSGVSGQPPSTALVFYAEPQVSEHLWPLLFPLLLEDLASDAGGLPEGVALDRQPAILRGGDDLLGVSFPHIVSVRLLGRCDLVPQANVTRAAGPLGWVLRVSGKVQPYIYIDCTRLAQVLQPATARMSKQGRQYALAQATCRVLIHEWVHIATQSAAHSSRGLIQPNLSIEDLIGPAHRAPLSAAAR